MRHRAVQTQVPTSMTGSKKYSPFVQDRWTDRYRSVQTDRQALLSTWRRRIETNTCSTPTVMSKSKPRLGATASHLCVVVYADAIRRTTHGHVPSSNVTLIHGRYTRTSVGACHTETCPRCQHVTSHAHDANTSHHMPTMPTRHITVRATLTAYDLSRSTEHVACPCTCLSPRLSVHMFKSLPTCVRALLCLATCSCGWERERHEQESPCP
jgi:hypothetical protein